MFFLLAVHGALLIFLAPVHSPVLDETAHLPAGLAVWELGRPDLYSVNPPLIRAIAAFPVWVIGCEYDWSAAGTIASRRPEFRLGRDFVKRNGQRAFWLFAVARWACVPFSLFGGYVCWRWAAELYGCRAGLIACGLWCFSPHVLGNACFVLPDVGATSVGLLAWYLFWRWLRNPNWQRCISLGVMVGIANLCKTTWIVMYMLLPVIWVVWLFLRTCAKNRPLRLKKEYLQVVAVLLVSIFVVNLGYGFQGTFTRLDQFDFVSGSLSGRGVPSVLGIGPQRSGNRFASTWLGKIPAPAPAAFIQGVDLQRFDFERKFIGYLRGEWREGGWWYYYLYAFTIKTPLGTLALMAVAVTVSVHRLLSILLTRQTSDLPDDRNLSWHDEVVLLAPAATILLLVSSQTGINMFLRYALPVVPFVFIWTSRVARTNCGLQGKLTWIPFICLLASVASSLRYFPHSASYFNELVGGPIGGPAHLIDSNIGWGQDLLFLKRWYDQNPDARPLGLVYFGNMDPRIAEIEYVLPARGPRSANRTCPLEYAELGPRPGWYAIDVSYVMGMNRRIFDGNGNLTGAPNYDCAFTYFQEFEPIDRAGFSINIYHISLEQANEARVKLGLEPIKVATTD